MHYRSLFVRARLTPLLSQHGASLFLSGHSHSYERGFLPSYLHSTYASVANSSSLPTSTREIAQNYQHLSHFDQDRQQRLVENGTVYTVLGGAGGTLDKDLVEDWVFYEKKENDKHFFSWMTLSFGVTSSDAKAASSTKANERVYRLEGRICEGRKREVLDQLELKTIDLTGVVIDRFRIEIKGCD